MDLNFDKKELKQYKKLGMTDAEIEDMRIKKLTEHILDANCTRASERLNRHIVFGADGTSYHLFLKSADGRCIELNCLASTLIVDYERALQELDYDLRSRLYFVR